MKTTTLARLGLAALFIGSLAGCGSSGGDGAPPPAGGGSSGVTTPPPLTGAATTVNYSNGATQFGTMTPVITVGGAGVSSAPVITFSLGDGNNNPYAGFDQIKNTGTTPASYPNFAFSIAKLVPGTNGSPSKWVSYIVTNTAGTAPQRPGTDNTGSLEYLGQGIYRYTFWRDITLTKSKVDAICTPACPNIPAVPASGTVPAIPAVTPLKGDLGDLTFDPNALHRVTIQFAGTAPGTGTNTPTGVNSGVTAVPLKNPLNVVYDFVPATGKPVAPTDAVTQRLIVDRLSCNECHGKLGGIPGTESQSFHGGSRYDPKYCVVCHTDQRKFGRNLPTIYSQVSTNFAFPTLTNTVNASGSAGYFPYTYIADGVTVGDFPVLIHRVHKGEELIKQNYNFANVLLNHTTFPQDLRNCDKCHSNTAPKVAPQATNYQTVPSRLACGACHDGINFATGQGITNHRKSIGHIGGIQNDDSKCALCHDPASIKTVYHVPVTPPNPDNALQVATGSSNTHAAWIASNRDNLPAGAIKVDYEIQSVSRNTSMQPVIVFRMLQNGVVTPFNTPPSPPAATGEIWNGFFGAPSVYFVWAVPQDGITAPADFNATASSYLRNLWRGTATGTSAGTLTGPDANGWYTATLTGVQVPDSAVMLSGGLGYSYNLTSALPLTQSGVTEPIGSNLALGTPRFGDSPSPVFPTNADRRIGGLIVVTPDKQVVASAGAGPGGTGGAYTGRRPIVDDAKCNNCHKELGMFTAAAFHGGQRNDGTTCAWCHTPNRASSGWSADASYFIHAIHGSDKREKPFTWHASAPPPNPKSFANVTYPGILSKCETCHVPGGYDFSSAAASSALPNRLYKTVATGIFNATAGTSINTYSTSTTPPCTVPALGTAQTDLGVYSLSLPSITPGITAGTNYGIGFSYNAGLTTANSCRPDGSGLVANPAGGTVAADPQTLVISPIAAACFSCHDSAVARQHMEVSGNASIYSPRSTALGKIELCMFCHDPGSSYGLGIKDVHNK